MSTSIQDPYLAESIGFASGRRRGEIDGFNHAAAQANQIIAQKDARINELTAGYNQVSSLAKELDGDVIVLTDQLKAAKNDARLAREQGMALAAENEKLKRLVLGLTAVARPALVAVSRLPFAERIKYCDSYISEAMNLLGIKFEMAEKFPHNLGSVVNHVPLSRELFYRTVHEGRALKAQQNNIEEARA
ncbi:hypothetical protein [Ottowia oryzae]